jgi:hypothetical protein
MNIHGSEDIRITGKNESTKLYLIIKALDVNPVIALSLGGWATINSLREG